MAEEEPQPVGSEHHPSEHRHHTLADNQQLQNHEVFEEEDQRDLDIVPAIEAARKTLTEMKDLSNKLLDNMQQIKEHVRAMEEHVNMVSLLSKTTQANVLQKTNSYSNQEKDMSTQHQVSPRNSPAFVSFFGSQLLILGTYSGEPHNVRLHQHGGVQEVYFKRLDEQAARNREYLQELSRRQRQRIERSQQFEREIEE